MMQANEVVKIATDLHQQGKLEEAERLYDKLLVRFPNQPELLYWMGTLYNQIEHSGKALKFLREASEMLSNVPEVWNNLGAAYRHIGDMKNATNAYEKSIALLPKADTYSNLAGVFVNAGNPSKCLEYCERALELDPDHYRAHHHRALAWLEMGNYLEGFKEYLWRKKLPEFKNRDFGPVPFWTGQQVGKLFIHGEQGLGDEIMFLSCLKEVQTHKRVWDIVVECAPRLIKLLSRSFPSVKFYGTHDEVMKHEVPGGIPSGGWAYCAMGDLPYFVRRESLSDFPRHLPYLEAPPITEVKKRVGISWFGGTPKTHDYARNLPFEWWEPIITRLREKGYEVVSLQYGVAGQHAKKFNLPHDQARIDDLDQLAMQITECEAVISVCNTTIHMAGALGVPCWILTPHAVAWRYAVSGPMPWYGSVRLFRQAEEESWKNVVARVVEAINADL